MNPLILPLGVAIARLAGWEGITGVIPITIILTLGFGFMITGNILLIMYIRNAGKL